MNSLIKVNVGSPVIYQGEVVTIIETVIVPNGVLDTGLVCLIYARKENGNTISATSDKFSACEDEEYEVFYPTSHHNTL